MKWKVAGNVLGVVYVNIDGSRNAEEDHDISGYLTQ